MNRYVIRHVSRDEVFTQGGFVKRERHTTKGPVHDDVGAITFDNEGDAKLYAERVGVDRESTVEVYEEHTRDDLGGVGKVKTEDFYGLGA